MRSIPYGLHLWICMSLFKHERQQRVLLIHNDGAFSQSVILLCVFPADLNPTEQYECLSDVCVCMSNQSLKAEQHIKVCF